MARSPRQVRHFLDSLDWSGHFELPDLDLSWLADQISAWLSGASHLCEACGLIRPVLVETTLGSMCEACLEEAIEEAKEIREELED